MGSRADEDEFTVLVTGFGPFREQYPVNPSWEIARSLPAHLPPLARNLDLDRDRDRDMDDDQPSPVRPTEPTAPPKIRILVHPEPIHVSYKTVRALVPSFWAEEAGDGEGRCRRRIDAVVHIGMAGPRQVYCLERLAHRSGYASADVDGEKLDDETNGGGSGGGGVWAGLPGEIESGLDIPSVYLRWRELCPLNVDVQISADPGRYLCDFIYYCSLSTLYRRHEHRRVCFLHVPADADDGAVERGREVALHLIRSVAESEIAARKRQHLAK